MVQSMRWFGPTDPVPLFAIRQAGATEVVTALHEVPNGDIWSSEAILERRQTIEAAGLAWTVVESLPVSEAIKRATPERERDLDHFRQSIGHLAAHGISVVTYNFMPLLDWTRTDLAFPMPDGALALRFDIDAVAAYDIHRLRGAIAQSDYTELVVEAAGRRHAAMSEAEARTLELAILAGLPGSEESFTAADFRVALDRYSGVDADALRANLIYFLEAVVPEAEAAGIRLVVHPDDPPFPLFGLPRVVSDEADLMAIFAAVPSHANGLCLCTGSLGVRADNDLPGMIERIGERIGFLHLRNVRRTGPRTFHEAAHLEGDVDMAAVVGAIYALSNRERRCIPMRPDHGHQMLDDLTKVTYPGYSAIGRLRGLAELRGLEMGIAAVTRSTRS
jgi:mannonate dehydratase